MNGAAVRDVVSAATLDDLLHARGSLRRAGACLLLVLWGQSERLLPPSALAYFRRHLLQARRVIEEPAGFGHSPHIDDPARVAERLLAFARTSAVGS